MKSKKNKVIEFHGSDKKCNSFGTLLCTNVNSILNKNKIFIGKIKENKAGKDIAFPKMIQHADRYFQTNKKKFWFNLQM